MKAKEIIKEGVEFHASNKKEDNIWYPVEGGPELRVANGNAHRILDVILPVSSKYNSSDYSGMITREEFPEVRRNIIKVLNSQKQQDKHISSTTIDQRKGHATMIDFGMSEEQLKYYMDAIMNIIAFAEKNNSACISWA